MSTRDTTEPREYTDAERDLLHEVLAEVNRAAEKFPGWPTDPIHAVAVLGEEFGELTRSVLARCYSHHEVSDDEIREEAVQTAAMALRFLLSLDRYQYRPAEQHWQIARLSEEEPRDDQ